MKCCRRDWDMAPKFGAGEYISTAYGRAIIEERRVVSVGDANVTGSYFDYDAKDDQEEVTLICSPVNWKLAGGQHPTFFLNEEGIVSDEYGVGDVVNVTYGGEGTIVGMRIDDHTGEDLNIIYVVELSLWNLAGGKSPVLFLQKSAIAGLVRSGLMLREHKTELVIRDLDLQAAEFDTHHDDDAETPVKKVKQYTHGARVKRLVKKSSQASNLSMPSSGKTDPSSLGEYQSSKSSKVAYNSSYSKSGKHIKEADPTHGLHNNKGLGAFFRKRMTVLQRQLYHTITPTVCNRQVIRSLRCQIYLKISLKVNWTVVTLL